MNTKYMRKAIEEAKKALECGEMPVGCIIVLNDKIVGRGYNKKENTKNSLMHAEIIAINEACKNIDDWRLSECEIYVTMEPCIMCMGAILESRIKTVYCALINNKTHNLNQEILKKENLIVNYNILSSECEELLSEFFIKIRSKHKFDN